MADQFKAPIPPEPKRTKSPMNSFLLIEITRDEIITKSNGKKSMQVNDFQTKFLKYANVLIVPIRIKIYNKCNREGIFPGKIKNCSDYPNI